MWRPGTEARAQRGEDGVGTVDRGVDGRRVGRVGYGHSEAGPLGERAGAASHGDDLVAAWRGPGR